jgi:hypothetical protein
VRLSAYQAAADLAASLESAHPDEARALVRAWTDRARNDASVTVRERTIVSVSLVPSAPSEPDLQSR